MDVWVEHRLNSLIRGEEQDVNPGNIPRGFPGGGEGGCTFWNLLFIDLLNYIITCYVSLYINHKHIMALF